MLKRKGNPNAGRKKEPDLKLPVTLMVRKSSIVGHGNLEMPIKDNSGNFTPEYQKLKNDLMVKLYETIEFFNEK